MPGFCLPSSFREVRIHPNDKINTALGISPRRPLSGWMNRHQQKVVGYLVEENRVLKGKLCGKRIRLTDDEPRRLAVKGKALGRKLLGEGSHDCHARDNRGLAPETDREKMGESARPLSSRRERASSAMGDHPAISKRPPGSGRAGRRVVEGAEALTRAPSPTSQWSRSPGA